MIPKNSHERQLKLNELNSYYTDTSGRPRPKRVRKGCLPRDVDPDLEEEEIMRQEMAGIVKKLEGIETKNGKKKYHPQFIEFVLYVFPYYRRGSQQDVIDTGVMAESTLIRRKKELMKDYKRLLGEVYERQKKRRSDP